MTNKSDANSKFKNMKTENGMSIITKYVMNHDAAYRKSLKKGKTIDEKTDAAFFKGVHEVIAQFLEDLKGMDVDGVDVYVDDDEFYYQYTSWLEGRDELIQNVLHTSGGRLIGKDKIKIAYFNGQKEALETILNDLEKYKKTQRMKGYSHKTPAKKTGMTKIMFGNIKGLENSVKKIF